MFEQEPSNTIEELKKLLSSEVHKEESALSQVSSIKGFTTILTNWD